MGRVRSAGRRAICQAIADWPYGARLAARRSPLAGSTLETWAVSMLKNHWRHDPVVGWGECRHPADVRRSRTPRWTRRPNALGESRSYQDPYQRRSSIAGLN